MKKIKIVLLAFVAVLAVSCGKKKDAKINTEPEEAQIEKYIKLKKLNITAKNNSGLRFILTNPNPSGAALATNQSVKVNYKGYLLDGKVFDEGSFNFILGIGQVIQGFDEGIAMLKVGEKGTLIFPSTIGYGAAGSGDIPPNSPLVFEIEVLVAQ